MKNIFYEGTVKIPYVNFNAEQGLLELKGRSTPENIEDTYRPLTEWVKEYVKNALDETVVNIHFEYFNSATSKALVQMFQVLARLQNEDKKIIINWTYADDDSLEYGQDFEDIIGIPFNYIPEEE